MTEPAWPSRAWRVDQSIQASLQEPSPPQADLMLVHVNSFTDLVQRDRLGTQQDHFRPTTMTHLGAVRTNTTLQLGTLISRQTNRLDLEHGTSHVDDATKLHASN